MYSKGGEDGTQVHLYSCSLINPPDMRNTAVLLPMYKLVRSYRNKILEDVKLCWDSVQKASQHSVFCLVPGVVSLPFINLKRPGGSRVSF